MTRRYVTPALCITVAALAAAVANAKDIYVSPAGNNNNSGASPEAAVATIAAAASKAQAGDTIWLAAGRYSESIVPTRSGQEGRPITFRSYGSGRAVITAATSNDSAIYIDGRSDIVIDGIDVDGGNRPPNARFKHFATIVNSTRITLRNGTFRNANGWHGIGLKGSSHVVIEDNVVDMVGVWDKPGDATGSGDAIEVRDSSNRFVVVRRNRVTHGGHNLLTFMGKQGVVQDNFFDNHWGDIEGGNAGYRAVALAGSDNIFQRNFVTRAGRGPGSKDTPPLMKVEGTDNIVRFNVLSRGYAEGILSAAAAHTVNGRGSRIYNNTLYDIGTAAWVMRVRSGFSLTDYVFQNNLVIDSRANASGGSDDVDAHFQLASSGSGATSGSRILGNLFAPKGGKAPQIYSSVAGGVMKLADAEARYPTFVLRNQTGRPEFISAALSSLGDFALKGGSQGVDQGLFLTTVTADGTSQNLPVADSRYFTDGHGLIPGDTIQLEGSTTRARVVKVDRASNTIVLAETLTFRKGQGVALAYSGAAPDIGAIEWSQGGQSRPLAPTGLRIE